MSLIHTVQAFNTAAASENKIHDDTVAARFGFTGGLVPGVEVFAYATHVPLAHFGAAWLERGRMDMRFVKPVYDGREATVTGTIRGDDLRLAVTSDGVRCAEGSAGMGSAGIDAPAHVVMHDRREPPAVDRRPPADETSLAAGMLLSTRPLLISREILDAYLADIRETAPDYGARRLIHPGLLLRACNSALVQNVVLPPWIHVGSRIQFLAVGRVGEAVEARAKVAANYERKGHRMVDLDVVILADGARPVAHVAHTAIYRLRG